MYDVNPSKVAPTVHPRQGQVNYEALSAGTLKSRQSIHYSNIRWQQVFHTIRWQV